MHVSGIAFALDEKSALFFLEYNDRPFLLAAFRSNALDSLFFTSEGCFILTAVRVSPYLAAFLLLAAAAKH
jgi:hypothetical protein